MPDGWAIVLLTLILDRFLYYLFLVLTWRPIISRSTGPIFTKS